MYFKVGIRSLVGLLFFALLSGCLAAGSSSSADTDNCRRDRARCLYDGQYEPGEQEYAEQAAKDLNRASTQRLRRSSWWW